jgi:large subunit ribosomal protein L37e
MGKGTAAMGKKSGKKNMIHCRRCGKRTYHIRKKKCSSCGYGKSKRLRSYKWQKK